MSDFSKLPPADAEGWIPWSGGENPVPGCDVEVKIRWRNGVPSEGSTASENMEWEHVPEGYGDGGDIIAFRLSPQKDGEGGLGETAPLQGCVPAEQTDEPASPVQQIISDEEIARVHGNANFGSMSPREVVNDGVRKYAVGYHSGFTQMSILREHGLITKPQGYDADLTKKGKAYARAIGFAALSHPVAAEGEVAGLGSFSQEAKIPALDAGAQPHIFLDCDGVLADFDTYAEAYFGMPPREYERQVGSPKFWADLEAKGDFYRRLPVMPDAHILMDGVRHLNPTILTGCPRGNWAEAQKVAWAEEHFPGVPIITCRSSDKRLHAKPGDVLIDDWNQHRARWIEHGGIWITHTDAETSLAALWAHYPSLKFGQERDPSTCGTKAEGRSLPIPPTTQERIAQNDIDDLDILVGLYATNHEQKVWGRLRKALLDHREER